MRSVCGWKAAAVLAVLAACSGPGLAQAQEAEPLRWDADFVEAVNLAAGRVQDLSHREGAIARAKIAARLVNGLPPAMSVRDVRRLHYVMQTLGMSAEDRAAATRDWFESSDAWQKSEDAGDINAMFWWVGVMGEAEEAAHWREVLGAHYARRIIRDEDLLSDAGLQEAAHLLGHLEPQLGARARRVGGAGLMELVAGDAEGFGAMDVWQHQKLRWLGSALGVESGEVKQWTSDWMSMGGVWSTPLGVSECNALYWWIAEGGEGERSDAARARVAERAERLVAQQPEALAEDGLHQLACFADLIMSDLDPALRPTLAEPLAELAAEPGALETLGSVWDLWRLRRVGHELGIPRGEVHGWVCDWVTDTGGVDEGFGAKEANALYWWLKPHASDPRAAAALDRVFEAARVLPAREPSSVVRFEGVGHEVIVILHEMNERLTPQEQNVLGMRVVDALAEHDTVFGRHWDFAQAAKVFDRSELVEYARDRLDDGEGRPNLNVAKLLTAIYFGTDAQHAWRDSLEARAEVGGDAGALWLLARADAANAFLQPPDRRELRPSDWVDQAEALAEGQEAQWACLAWRAYDHAKYGRLSQARALLQAGWSEAAVPEAFRAHFAGFEGLLGEPALFAAAP